MLADNLLDILWLHASIPDCLWIDNHHWTMTALIQTAALIDAYTVLYSGGGYLAFERRMYPQPVAIHFWTVFAAGADENMLLPDKVGDFLRAVIFINCHSIRCVRLKVRSMLSLFFVL